MDNKMTNSPLLENFFKRAEEIKQAHDRKILTVNHIFAAILEYLYSFSNMEAFEKYGDPAEAESLLRMGLDFVSPESVQDKIEFLCSKNESYLDDVHFRQIVIASKKDCELSKKSQITADVFMKCILDSPTEEIKALASDGIAKNDSARVFVKQTVQDDSEQEESKKAKGDDKTLKVTPKEYLSELTRKVKSMQNALSSEVFGQDNAISIVSSGYFQSELRQIFDKDSKKPKATFLFAGPPGVGKTFLAQKIADFLSMPLKRFDMSEFCENESVMELVGTNASFKGDKEGALTSFVKENPKCVLLFDEIEKAHIFIIHLFLQILDAGRLRDVNSGRETDFSQAIIIFTTNAGRKIYEDSTTENLSGISRKAILKALEKDVDPKTGKSAFPAAICSRFAMGNVVMFNHMEAHTLRKIAKKEITKCIVSLEETTGIRCSVSEDVYSCVLFAEGGHADARTVSSRAGSFFSSELYELFRLVSNEENNLEVENIEEIKITLELPEDEKVFGLFRNEMKGSVLTFGDKVLSDKLSAAVEKNGYKNIFVNSLEEAKEIVEKEDVDFVFCDLYIGRDKEEATELNIEDIESEGRELFRFICESTDLPLYILSDNNHQYTEEEKVSLLKEGARDIVDVTEPNVVDSFIAEILMQLHHQQSMINLAKANKIIAYETSQSITDNGKTAEIKLFDIELQTVVDAEDSGRILSNMSKPKTRFTDVIGAKEAKEELAFFVDYLKNPKAYSSKGLGVPKGVLFYGPPGTGKTLLAKAVAGESDVTFISTEGNQFMKKYVGEGEEAVHNLFAVARKYAPTIIFIDEIDTIAKERSGEKISADSILTAFLSEMDGFKTDPKKPIFVLGATNFDVKPGSKKSLDDAFVRRFDRSIYVDLPDKNARIEFLNMRFGSKPIFDITKEMIENIAVRSTGMSFAKLEAVIELSLRIAVRGRKDKINDEIIEEAFESYNYGEEKCWDESTLKAVAYHEAGHAFLCWYSGEKPSYLTIVARGDHGGYMAHGDSESTGIYTKKMICDKIRTSLGGRASELVFFGEEDGLTTGAGSDLANATGLARRMVCSFAMDDDLGMAVITEGELLSGGMAQTVRDAVNKILAHELEMAKKIIEENRSAVETLVENLLKENHLNEVEIDEILSNCIIKRIG